MTFHGGALAYQNSWTSVVLKHVNNASRAEVKTAAALLTSTAFQSTAFHPIVVSFGKKVQGIQLHRLALPFWL